MRVAYVVGKLVGYGRYAQPHGDHEVATKYLVRFRGHGYAIVACSIRNHTLGSSDRERAGILRDMLENIRRDNCTEIIRGHGLVPQRPNLTRCCHRQTNAAGTEIATFVARTLTATSQRSIETAQADSSPIFKEYRWEFSASTFTCRARIPRP